MISTDTISFKNKIIPEEILEEARTALSYYPELKEVPIEFKFKSSLNKSFMKAQPKIPTLFAPKNKRGYVILMSRIFKVENIQLHIKDIPKEVLIGWLGHELGHIMDYRNRSSTNLALFGIKYFLSQGYIRKAERIADTYAVTHNMKDYILATKEFILSKGDLPEIYKSRIRRLYLSPDEILMLVKEQEGN